MKVGPNLSNFSLTTVSHPSPVSNLLCPTLLDSCVYDYTDPIKYRVSYQRKLNLKKGS